MERLVIKHRLQRSAADLHEIDYLLHGPQDGARCHALLHWQKGRRLPPAYDLVLVSAISLERRDLASTVGNFGRTDSIYNLLSQVGRFGQTTADARAAIDSLVEVIRPWREGFYASGVSAKDIENIAPAMLPDCFFCERR